MLCREYGILPIEPVIQSTNKTIEVNISNTSGIHIEENFLQCKVSKYNRTIEYIDQPIKGASNVNEASIISFSLSNIDNIETFKNTLRGIRKPIEIKDTPKFATNYASYKGTILSIISTITNRITINTDEYLGEIIKDISSYNGKIQALGTSIFGLCGNQSPNIENFLHYSVNTKVLIENIRILKNNNIDLILDVDSICHATESITNTYASQLWLFDFLCQISSIGIKNVFVNMDSYSNVYSILAYLYCTRNNSILNPYNSIKDSNVNIYISENIKEYFIIIINKDIYDDVVINVNTPYSNNGDIIRFITNQTYKGTCGMTFGELTFDGSKDGYPIQVKTREKNIRFSASSIDPENKEFTAGTLSFAVSHLSIAILKINKMQSGGAYFENINEADENETVVTILPNPNEEDSTPTTMTIKNFGKDYQPYM